MTDVPLCVDVCLSCVVLTEPCRVEPNCVVLMRVEVTTFNGVQPDDDEDVDDAAADKLLTPSPTQYNNCRSSSRSCRSGTTQ